MTARTIEELGDHLDDSLQWRRLELHALKAEIQSLTPTNASLPRGRALLRATAALMYAHWEGYTKEACQGYLDFVATRRLKFGEVSDAFVLLGALATAGAASRGDPSANSKLVELIRRGPDMRAVIQRKGPVNTRSNLRYETLCEIFDALDLPLNSFETRAALIDRSLCDVRNSIAHGRANFPDRDALLDLHSEVLSLLENVRELVLFAARTARYKATTSDSDLS